MADVHHAAHVGTISKSKASPATLAGRSHASGTPADLSGTLGVKELTILVPLTLAFLEGGTDSILFPVAVAWRFGAGRCPLFSFLE